MASIQFSCIFDGQRPHEAQAGDRVRKDAHDERAPFELFHQTLQHVCRFQIFVMLSRQAVEAEGLFDVLLHPVQSFG